MNNSQMTYILQAILMVLGVVLGILLIVLAVIIVKKISNRNIEKKANKKNKKNEKVSATAGYNKQSIFDFMEFDRIEDNMIIQKDKVKYIMVIECQGINYDLMSGIEKVSVEQGFIQFLNTLRQSIQLYTQTRAVNLGSSISTYKEKVTEIGNKLNKMVAEYNQMVNSNVRIDEQELQRLQFEITKQRNLYEYGIDIVNNTEKMSLNRSVLRKYYYVVVPYYIEDVGDSKYDSEELKGMAFSELYTNCQSIIQSLGACGIHCKILNSRELVELLYVAYNRDESEDYDVEKVLRSGYTELYTTAQDVLDKKMKELDKVINQRAKILANNSIRDAVIETKKEKMVREKEERMNDLINEQAERMVNANKAFLGANLASKAIEKIENAKTESKGGNEDGKKQTRRATGKRKQ